MDCAYSMKSILIVDDSQANIRIIGDILASRYQVRAANSGDKALKIANKTPAPDLILLDVQMPDMDGYAVLNELRANQITADIPVIFVTAMDEVDDEEFGLSLGAVDYITKPVRPAILLARLRTHLELKSARDHLKSQNLDLESEVERRVQESNLIRDISMKALSSLAKTRDNETGNHILRTQGYVDVLARYLASKPAYAEQLDARQIEFMVKAALLHDIGKVGIPDAILLKPAKLTPEEFAIMKTHARLGADALRSCTAELDVHGELDFLNMAIEIANYHHEHWDGSGYPEGLSGESIPLSGRLMALADVFDALISKRVYKPAFSYDEAIRIIREGSGSHFDPAVVEAFDAMKDRFIEIAEKYRDEAF
jgi:putative two-component system response regulator